MGNNLERVARSGKSHISYIPVDEEITHALMHLGVLLCHDEQDYKAMEHVEIQYPISSLPNHFLHRQTVNGVIVFRLISPDGELLGSHHYSPKTESSTLIDGGAKDSKTEGLLLIDALTEMIYSARGIKLPRRDDPDILYQYQFPSAADGPLGGL